MFQMFVTQFIKSLRNLDAILHKARAHAEARKFSPDNFLQLRMSPDMFTFAKQVQTACDVAKNAASTWAGRDVPVHEDREKSLNELHERIATCVTYLETFTAADFHKTQPDTTIKVPYPPGKMMLAGDALVSRAVPNFFFHLTAAYCLLRMHGVEVGKTDYLGAMKFV